MAEQKPAKSTTASAPTTTRTETGTNSPAATTSGGSTQSRPMTLMTQAEMDAREAVERSRTDPDVADPTGPRVGAYVEPGANDGPTAEEAAEDAARDGHRTGEAPRVTRFEGQRPGEVGYTAPGDAPHDTTDPREIVSTVIPSGEQMAEAVKAGHGSVVAAVKVGEIAESVPESRGRVEEYDVQTDSFGGTARVRRDMDTGVSERIG